MKFDKYGGKVSFTVAEEKLEFDRVKTERLQTLSNYVKDQDNFMVNVSKFFTEEMKKNYPEESEDCILAFVQSNIETLFEEYQIAVGLINREEYEKAKEKAKEKAMEELELVTNGKTE